MIKIATPVGDAFVNDEAITRIIGPLPSRPYTQIWGPGKAGAVETSEAPEDLISRLQLSKPLVQFASPDGQPVWIKGSAVDMVRPPTRFEVRKPPIVTKSIVIVGNQPQAIQQDVPTAVAAIQAAGGLLDPGMHPLAGEAEIVASYTAPSFKIEDYRPF